MNSSHLFILGVVVHCPCADAILLSAAVVVGRVVIPGLWNIWHAFRFLRILMYFEMSIHLHAAVSIVFLAIDSIDVSPLQTLAHAENLRAFTLEVAVGLEHVDQAHKSHEDRDWSKSPIDIGTWTKKSIFQLFQILPPASWLLSALCSFFNLARAELRLDFD